MRIDGCLSEWKSASKDLDTLEKDDSEMNGASSLSLLPSSSSCDISLFSSSHMRTLSATHSVA